MKDISEKKPVSEWRTLGVYVLFLIVVLAMILLVIFAPLDTVCLIEDTLFTVFIIVMSLAGYILVRSKRVRAV